MRTGMRRPPGWLVIAALLLQILAPAGSAQVPPVAAGDSLLLPPLTEAWTLSLQRTTPTPVLGDGRVFVVDQPSDSYLHAHDLATGTKLWSRKIAARYGNLPVPAYQDGLLVVRDGPRLVHGLDPATGEIRWSLDLQEGETMGAPVPGLGGRFYLKTTAGLIALDRTGKVLWRQPAPAGELVVGGDLLFAGSKEGVTALDAQSGTVRWNRECPCSWNDSVYLVHADGLLLLHVGDWNHGEIYALDPETGQVVWKQELLFARTAVAWNGVAYVPLSGGQEIARIHLADGQMLAPIQIGGMEYYGGLIAADGMLYIGGVMAVDLESGQVVWQRARRGLDQTAGEGYLLLSDYEKLTVLAPASPVQAGSVSGSVQSSQTGAPIAGARVHLDGLPYHAVTDAAGRFRLRGPAGLNTLVVRADNHGEGRLSATLHPSAPPDLTVALEPADRQALTVHVVDGDLSIPIPGASLSLPEEGAMLPVVTNADGTAQLSLTPGTYRLVVKAPHYDPATLAVSTGEQSLIRLQPILTRPDNWVAHGAGPDGSNTTASLLAPPLVQEWSLAGHKVRKGTRPLVVDGRVHVLTEAGELLAVDLHTGKLLWSQAADTSLTPAYDRGIIFVPHWNELRAFDATTGELRWSRQIINIPTILGRPIAKDGRLYLSKLEVGRPQVQVFDGETGQLLWSFRPVGPSRSGFSNLTLSGNTLYMAASYPHLYAFDAATGEPLWTQEDCSCTSGSTDGVVAAAGMLLHTELATQNLVVRDEATGAIRWQRKGYQGVPVVHDDRVYVPTTVGKTEVLRLSDGEPLGLLDVTGELALADGYLIGDDLKVIDLESGLLVGSYYWGGTATVAAGDRVLTVGADRWLVAFRSAGQVPEMGYLYGTVAADTGSRLMAEVRVGDRLLTSSPADGSFALRLPAGAYTLTGSAPHHGEAEATVTVEAGKAVRSLLLLSSEPPISLTGRVTSAATGSPLKGARLSAGEGAPVYTTGPDGTFSLSLTPGVQSLRVEAAGYRIRYLTVPADQSRAVADIALEPGPAGDCPLPGCDPARTGSSYSPGGPPYEKVWSNWEIHSFVTPVVARGMLFGIDLEGYTYAVHLATGRRAWRVQVQRDYFPDPIGYGDGKLFGGDGNGRLLALDADTGQLLWETPLGRGQGTTVPVYSNGRVYVGHEFLVYALDAQTGAVLWKSPADDWARSLSVGNGRVVVATTFEMVALDQATGERLWGPVPGIGGTPIVAGNLVLTTKYSEVFAVEATTGEVRWKATGESPVVKGSLVYVWTKKGVQALVLATGAPLWSLEVKDVSYGRLVLSGDTLLVDGAVAIDLNSRREIWRYEERLAAIPLLAEGYLLLIGDPGPTVVLRATP